MVKFLSNKFKSWLVSIQKQSSFITVRAMESTFCTKKKFKHWSKSQKYLKSYLRNQLEKHSRKASRKKSKMKIIYDWKEKWKFSLPIKIIKKRLSFKRVTSNKQLLKTIRERNLKKTSQSNRINSSNDLKSERNERKTESHYSFQKRRSSTSLHV